MKENSNLKIDIINEISEEFVPSKKNIKVWLRRSMDFINEDIDIRRKSFEVSYKIISSDSMRDLNNKFRKKKRRFSTHWGRGSYGVRYTSSNGRTWLIGCFGSRTTI